MDEITFDEANELVSILKNDGPANPYKEVITLLICNSCGEFFEEEIEQCSCCGSFDLAEKIMLTDEFHAFLDEQE